MESPVLLLLLDDHTLFRVMLSRLLEMNPFLHVVAHCSSASDAVQFIKGNSIDLVLLDYDLGNRETGMQFISMAREAGYSGRMIIVTAGMQDAEYAKALRSSVSGIFLKHSSPELLMQAIERVIAGEVWIDQKCIQALAQAAKTESESQVRRLEFTERERQVLKYVFEGLSNKEIGGQLKISEASVKSALQQLFLKTGVRTRSQLVRVALEEYGSNWR